MYKRAIYSQALSLIYWIVYNLTVTPRAVTQRTAAAEETLAHDKWPPKTGTQAGLQREGTTQRSRPSHHWLRMAAALCLEYCRWPTWPSWHTWPAWGGWSQPALPRATSKNFLRLASFLHKRPLSRWKKAEKFKKFDLATSSWSCESSTSLIT